MFPGFLTLVKVTVTCVIRLSPMGCKTVYVKKQPVAWKVCCVVYWCGYDSIIVEKGVKPTLINQSNIITLHSILPRQLTNFQTFPLAYGIKTNAAYHNGECQSMGKFNGQAESKPYDLGIL